MLGEVAKNGNLIMCPLAPGKLSEWLSDIQAKQVIALYREGVEEKFISASVILSPQSHTPYFKTELMFP